MTLKQADAIESSSTKRDRMHFLDAFRVIMLLLGIPFHASESFRTGDPWIISPITGSPLLGIAAHTIHSFRMFAFFLISGYFSTLILSKKTPGAWLRARMVRLGAPLIAGVLLLAPVELAALARHRAAIDETTDFGTVYGHLLGANPGMWISHRWFLVTLILYSLAITGFMIPSVQSTLSRRLRVVDLAIERRWTLSSAIFVVALALWGVVDAAPFQYIGRSLAGGTILIDRVLAYAAPFFFGCFLGLRPVAFQRYMKSGITAVIMAIVALVVYDLTADSEGGIGKLIFRLSIMPAGFFGTKVILGMARRYLSTESRVVRVLVDAAFVIYLVHLVGILSIGGALMEMYDAPILSAVATSIGTLAGSVVFYFAIRRSRLAGYLFNGAPFQFGAQKREAVATPSAYYHPAMK